MLKSQHISDADLLEMINGHDDSEKSRDIGQHLHQCDDCRKKLDALTAKSAMWEKAPALLKSNRLSESDMISMGKIALDEKTLGFPRQKNDSNPNQTNSNESEEPGWQFPIDQLLDPPKHPEMIGRIGKYDIEREIGRGGMGVVLKGHDAELNRPLAIKILAPHLACNGTARKRFAQEAIAAAGVIHPNVVAVHGVNNEGKTPYIVMPYVAGWSLQSLVDQQGPLTEIEITRIALQISSGLAAAHSQGLVHRDIKPANILVEADVNRVLITDFGLARAEDDASLTRTGWLTGTPNYMSPEQTRGDRPDQRTDLFSLGSLIYFLATGRLPFRAETPFGVLSRIQKENPTPVRQVNNLISKTLADVITKLLQKDPLNRFQTSAELHEFLERHLAYLHQPDISKPPRVAGQKGRGWKRAAKPILATAAAAVLGCSALAYSGVIPSPWNNPVSHLVPVGNENEDTAESESYLNAFGLFETGKFDQAIEGFEQSAESEKFQGPANHYIGTILAKQGKDEEAKEMFKQANKHYQAGEMKEALELYQKTAAFDRYAEDSYYNVGCILAILDKPDESLKALAESIEAGFDDVQHFKTDLDLKSLHGDQRFLDLIAKVEVRDSANELLKRGLSAADDKQFKEAESLCRKSLELLPDNDHAALNLGYAIHMQGRYDDALPWFERAANSKDHAALGNYNLCCYYSLKNEKEKALDFLEKAIEADLPSNITRRFIDNDSDLNNIRNEKRFELARKHFPSLLGFDNVRRFMSHKGMFQISTGKDDGMSMSLYSPDEVAGKWEASLRDGNVELRVLRTIPDSDTAWGFSANFKPSAFTPAISAEVTEFRLEKKFGSLIFTGSFTGKIGEGTFKFSGSEDYRKTLADKGIADASDALLFRLYFSWQDETQVIANLQKLQKLGLDKKTLQVLMIDGVQSSLAKKYQNAKLPIDKHLQFVIWRVEPKLLLGYKKAGLDLETHKKYINQRIQAKLIVAYNNAGLDLKEHQHFLSSRVEPKI